MELKITNRHRLILALSLNKLADLLISAKTTLTALLLSLALPVWMVGSLVPIRESGALLPQVFISIYLRHQNARHRVWRVGMIIQMLSVLGMLTSALLLDGVVAGGVILVALACFSLGRSACSLTIKDMEADIVEKGKRGNLIGIASTISGVATLAIALPLYLISDALDTYMLAGIIGFSVVVFGLTLIAIWPVNTHVEVKTHQQKAFSFDLGSTVYKFVVVRGLFVHSALVAPYFMIQKEASATDLLPIYIAAEAGATLLSSLIWGKIADKSARLTLQIAGILALISCIGLLFSDGSSLVVSAGLFFALSVSHAGVRTGRKTYSLDVKEGHERTELVGFSNTAIGFILLAFGSLYAVITTVISFSVVYIMATALAVAIVATFILPKEK